QDVNVQFVSQQHFEGVIHERADSYGHNEFRSRRFVNDWTKTYNVITPRVLCGVIRNQEESVAFFGLPRGKAGGRQVISG
ncbi:MAG: hypothetical protein ACKO2P_01070, partial [Planctomycetota bacterium]